MNGQDLVGIPPWLLSFLVHVVKRCCGVLVNWIDLATEVNDKVKK